MHQAQLREMLKLGAADHLDPLIKKTMVGALEMDNKQVKDKFRRLKEVFMVEEGSFLNKKLVQEIIDSGFTRIPVYKDQKTNIVGILLVRDLVMMDLESGMELKKLLEQYNV